MTVVEVLDKVGALTPREREELLPMLVDLLAKDGCAPKRRLSELRGLGKEAWQGIDANAYVDDLRSGWDRPRRESNLL